MADAIHAAYNLETTNDYDMKEDDFWNEFESKYMTDDWAENNTEEDLSWVPEHLINEAKKEELTNLDHMKTFHEISEEEACQLPDVVRVDARWVVTNKGTKERPKIKGRLVCREFAQKDGMDLFAGTPGLAAVRLLLSHHCSGNSRGRVLGIVDVKGAFLYGKARRNVVVRLPDGRLVQLDRSLYGTRDAPQIWAEHLS